MTRKGSGRTRLCAAAVLVAGVACQPDRPERLRAGEDTAPRVSAAEAPEVEPVAFRVFDEQNADEVGPGRTTLHVLVSAEATREELRATLSHALLERAESDTTAVALRAVAYLGETRGRVGTLRPALWAEWLPPTGWYEAGPGERDAIHRIYVYDAPPEW